MHDQWDPIYHTEAQVWQTF